MSGWTPAPWKAITPPGELASISKDTEIGDFVVADLIEEPKDAHLIAAAPELYAALDGLLTAINDLDLADKDEKLSFGIKLARAQAKAYAVLLKAEGEPS